MTRTGWIVAVAALIIAGAGGWVLRGSTTAPSVVVEGHDHTSEIAYYTCPMHPSVKADSPGSCPICGMDLTAVPRSGTPVSAVEPTSGFIELTPQQQQMIGVTVGEVTAREARTEVRAVGRVVYDETRLADVNLKVSGWVQDLYADHVGKAVRRGDPLLTVYSPELVASQEEYLLAYRGMFGMEQGSGVATWNQRLLQTARERLALWDMTDEQIADLDRTGKRSTAVTVYAPTDGIIIERMAVAGMFVKPDMRLYRIAQLDSVWILADVYENELPFVRVSQRATITPSYLPRESFEGAVDYVYPALDAKTRTATVRIQTGNRQGTLKPGMFADVLLHRTQDTRLLVPEPAVIFSGRRRIVFLDLGEGRFKPREIFLGRRFLSGYQVLSGLKPGDRVVTSANFLLDSESKLKNVLAGMSRCEH